MNSKVMKTLVRSFGTMPRNAVERLYASWHKVLVVGDSNFEFSNGLAEVLKPDEGMMICSRPKKIGIIHIYLLLLFIIIIYITHTYINQNLNLHAMQEIRALRVPTL